MLSELDLNLLLVLDAVLSERSVARAAKRLHVTPSAISNALARLRSSLGDPLVELETDKVTVEVPAPAAGVLKEQLVKEGDTVEVGAKLGVIFGIGRVCHIAFWEPHFAGEYTTEAEWKAQSHRIGAKLHPLTIEQNAITSFKSRTTLVPAYANTIGPALFLKADKIIGGADGSLGRGMMWQGLSLWMTLRHKPTPWIPSSFMPTQAGRLFFLEELAGPLVAECN